MKKNKMMRAASFLLVAVLLTTSVISGTFAKYVTSAEAKDTARVAKWGVTVTATGEYFADAYDTDDAVYTGARSVITSGATGDALVAPGTTKADVTTIKITGTPEVAARAEFVGTATLNDKWKVDGTFYCPIVVTIKDNANNVKATIDGATYNSADEFEIAIETYINNFSQEYDPNEIIDNQDNSALKISWAWPFSVSDVNDVKDTALGKAAADNVANAGTIDIGVVCTVTQID